LTQIKRLHAVATPELRKQLELLRSGRSRNPDI